MGTASKLVGLARSVNSKGRGRVRTASRRFVARPGRGRPRGLGQTEAKRIKSISIWLDRAVDELKELNSNAKSTGTARKIEKIIGFIIKSQNLTDDLEQRLGKLLKDMQS